MADKKQIILGVGLDSTDVKQGTEEISRSVNKMAGDVARESINAGKAVSKIGDEALSSAEDFSKAESKIIQSIQRRTAALEAAGKGARAYQEALISNRGLDPAKFDAYLSKLDAADKATHRLGQTTANVGSGVSGQFSNNLRNASFQIQDFAVQVNGGVDATKALAMQLPQMLVGFGTAGAVIGVFAALLPNLITLMGGVGDGSKKLADAIGDLDKAIGDVGSTVKTFDMDGLYKQFNNANKATQAAIVGQLEFQKVFLETSRLVASKKFGEEIGGLGSFGTLDKLAGAYASSGSEKLAKQLGVSLDVAKDLLPVLNGLKNGTEDVNNAFSRFGTSLLSGNAESRALASSMASLAKSERDAAAASSAISEAQEKMSKGHVTTKKELEAANKAQKEHNTELEKFQALMDKINGKDTGLDAGYWKDLEALHNAYGKGRLNIEQYRDAVGKLTMSQKFYTDQLKQQADVEASRAKYLGNIEKETEELVKKAEAAELENARIGMTTEQLEELNRKRYESQIAILSEKAAAIEAMGVRNEELDNIEKQIDALRRLQSAEVARPKLQQQAREWEKFTDQIGQSLTDALYRAFESGEGFGKSFAKTLENTLKATFAKLMINTVMATGGNLTNTAINAILGTSGANGGNGTNYLGLANNASSIYNLANGTYAGMAANAYSYGSTALGYTYGTGALSQQSMMLAAQDAGLAGSTTGSGSLSGLSSGTVAWVAAIVAGMWMSSQAWKQGIRWDNYAKQPGVQYWDAEVGMRALHDKPAEMLFGKDFVNSEFYAVMGGGSLSAQIHYAIQNALFGRERMTGSQISGTFTEAEQGFTGRSGVSMKKSGGLFSGSKEWTEWSDLPTEVDGIFDALYRGVRNSFVMLGDVFDDTSLAGKISGFTLAFTESAGTETIESTVNLMATRLTEAMGKSLLPSIEGLAVTTEQNGKQITESWAQTFERVVIEANAVNAAFDLVGESLASLYGNNTDKILAASDAFVKLFGSIDAMTGAVNSYYENFYTSAEKQARAWEQMGKQFDALNVSTPTTREQFRALVEAQDLSTAAGQRTFASLMNLQGAFAQLTPTLDAAAAKAISSERTSLENRIFQLQGNTAALRQREIESINAANRPLQMLIYHMEDFQAATQSADSAMSRMQSARSMATQAYLSASAEVESAQQALLNAQIQQQQALKSSLEASANSLRGFTNSIDDFLKSLKLSGSSSPESAYQSSKTSFRETVAKAQGGDKEALSSLTKSAGDYLQTSKAYNASGDGYVADENFVKQMLESINVGLNRQITGFDQQAAAIAIPQAQDPVAEAQQKLQDALSKQADAAAIANEIGASLSDSVTSILDEYRSAQSDWAKATADAAILQAQITASSENTLLALRDTSYGLPAQDANQESAVRELVETNTVSIPNVVVQTETINATLGTINQSTIDGSSRVSASVDNVRSEVVSLREQNAYLAAQMANMAAQLSAIQSEMRRANSQPAAVAK